MAKISDLSCDLVEEILSRVPITCLVAVRSTCRRWNTLSKSRLLCKAKADHQFLGFMIKNAKLCSLRYDLNEEFAVKEITMPMEICEVLVCEGLLLCVTLTRDEDNHIHHHLMMSNPYLGQTRWIQPSSNYDRSDIYALGYDDDGNHKILRYYGGFGDKEACEIYDLKSDTWTTLDVTLNWGCGMEYFHSSTSLKGNTYFVDYDGFDESYSGLFLCFDFTRERFGEKLHLPWSQDHSYNRKLTPISCFGEEKLAALDRGSLVFGMEIWVTTKIEPNEVLWSKFLKIDLEAIPAYSFFNDEEKKRAVIFARCSYENESFHAAYIFGENDFFKIVDLGETKYHYRFPNYPLVSSNSYVPSLVQIQKKMERERRVRASPTPLQNPLQTPFCSKIISNPTPKLTPKWSNKHDYSKYGVNQLITLKWS